MAGEYPPGSSIKPFMALSALREGFMTKTSTKPCTPEFSVPQDIPGQVWHNWSTADMGYLNLAQALVVSCDTVFYNLAYYDYWSAYYPPPDPATQPDRQPKELMQRDLASFGFGKAPLVDAAGARPGLVPDTEWKYEHYYKPRYADDTTGEYYCTYAMCPGDFINMSIGQGNMTATPLQMATAFGAIANGGKLCEPQLAMEADRPDGAVIEKFQPACHQVSDYSPQWFKYVRAALAGVVTGQGTANSAFAGFPINQLEYFGGKTGTAQLPPPKQDAAWFASIVKGTDKQGNDKEYVIVAFVEQGGHGSETAAPIVRRIVGGLYGLRDGSAIRIGAAAD
jgi:penicillin-binding protein 2